MIVCQIAPEEHSLSLSLSLSLLSFPILTRVYAHTTRVVDALLRRNKRDNRAKANQSASLRESFRTIFLVISLLLSPIKQIKKELLFAKKGNK